jgi:hypothetical protein
LSPPAVATGLGPEGIAITSDGRFLYVTDSSASAVSQYARGADGTLTPLSPPTAPARQTPVSIAVTPSATGPSTKEDCKQGGWRRFGRFRNQGDCISFVATGGRNPPG